MKLKYYIKKKVLCKECHTSEEAFELAFPAFGGNTK